MGLFPSMQEARSAELPEAGATSSCEPPPVNAGNRAPVFSKAVHAFNLSHPSLSSPQPQLPLFLI